MSPWQWSLGCSLEYRYRSTSTGKFVATEWQFMLESTVNCYWQWTLATGHWSGTPAMQVPVEWANFKAFKNANFIESHMYSYWH